MYTQRDKHTDLKQYGPQIFDPGVITPYSFYLHQNILFHGTVSVIKVSHQKYKKLIKNNCLHKVGWHIILRHFKYETPGVLIFLTVLSQLILTACILDSTFPTRINSMYT